MVIWRMLGNADSDLSRFGMKAERMLFLKSCQVIQYCAQMNLSWNSKAWSPFCVFCLFVCLILFLFVFFSIRRIDLRNKKGRLVQTFMF